MRIAETPGEVSLLPAPSIHPLLLPALQPPLLPCLVITVPRHIKSHQSRFAMTHPIFVSLSMPLRCRTYLSHCDWCRVRSRSEE